MPGTKARQQVRTGNASSRPGGKACKGRVTLARGPTTRQDRDDFAKLTAVVKAHQQMVESTKPDIQFLEATQPPLQSQVPIIASAVRLPIKVHVNMMNCKALEVHAEPQELVAHLRRRVAKAVHKPLTQLVLTSDASVLHGMQLVSEVVGEAECVCISAFLSAQCGPVEEWMNDDHPEGLTEYMPELYSKLKDNEKRTEACISSAYMLTQKDISARMRAILVDWLVEVHEKYRLRTVSLCLAVQIMDRYLQAKNISRKKLQLVGMAAMLVSSKFEEVFSPELTDFVHMSAGAFTKEELITMEVDMLNTLGFNLCTSTACHFMDLYRQANRCNDDHGFAIQYLLELTLLDIELAGELPSKKAAAATFLSNELLSRDVAWPEGMASYTGYTADSLHGVAQKIRVQLDGAAASALRAVYLKFSSSRYGGIAGKLV